MQKARPDESSACFLKDRDIEKLKFGHKDASKKEAVALLSFAGVVYIYREEICKLATHYINSTFLELSLEQYVSAIALFTVVPHFVEIVYQYGWLRGLSWAIKIFTVSSIISHLNLNIIKS